LENLLPFLILLQSSYCTFPCYVRRIQIQAYLASLPNSYHKPLLAVLNGPHALNIKHNPRLESIHYNIGWSGFTAAAVHMLSAISSDRTTTVGFDISHLLVCGVEEERPLKNLGTIMASNNLSGVSCISIRLEYDWDYTRSDHPGEAMLEHAMRYSLDVIYGAFQFTRARGILEVEHLSCERHDSDPEGHITNDCFVTKIPTDTGGG
jgi:hypothetical protein